MQHANKAHSKVAVIQNEQQELAQKKPLVEQVRVLLRPALNPWCRVWDLAAEAGAEEAARKACGMMLALRCTEYTCWSYEGFGRSRLRDTCITLAWVDTGASVHTCTYGTADLSCINLGAGGAAA